MPIEKTTYRSGPYKSLMAQGVRVGNTLHLSGQVGMEVKGKAGESMAEQTRLAYENIQHVLSQFDATLDNVVDETMYVTDMDQAMANMEEVYGARAAAYGGVPEVCQTLVEISKLVHPDLKLEIKCTAQFAD